MSTVTVECYLIIGQRISALGRCEGKPSVRVSKGKPSCEPHEIPLLLKLELPVSVFRRPQLVASIKIGDDAAPPVIDASVQENITATLREHLGINILLTAPPAAPYGEQA